MHTLSLTCCSAVSPNHSPVTCVRMHTRILMTSVSLTVVPRRAVSPSTARVMEPNSRLPWNRVVGTGTCVCVRVRVHACVLFHEHVCVCVCHTTSIGIKEFTSAYTS